MENGSVVVQVARPDRQHDRLLLSWENQEAEYIGTYFDVASFLTRRLGNGGITEIKIERRAARADETPLANSQIAKLRKMINGLLAVNRSCLSLRRNNT